MEKKTRDGLYRRNIMNKYKEKGVCVNEMKIRKKCPRIILYYILRSCQGSGVTFAMLIFQVENILGSNIKRIT